MPIIGFSISKIEGIRDEQPPKYDEIKINSTPRIESIEEVNIPNTAGKVLSMKFEFETRYTPNIGNMKIEGRVLYSSPNHKEILELWKKENRLGEKEAREIFNYLFRKCLVKMVGFADELQLPIPLPIPRIKPNQK